MIGLILRRLSHLHLETALLEALDWDEELRDSFVEELNIMLLASPPNVEKALFWLQNTPWDTFGGKNLPENVYLVVKNVINKMQQDIYREAQEERENAISLPHFRKNNTNGEWN
jgi:hypothetical protein